MSRNGKLMLYMIDKTFKSQVTNEIQSFKSLCYVDMLRSGPTLSPHSWKDQTYKSITKNPTNHPNPTTTTPHLANSNTPQTHPFLPEKILDPRIKTFPVIHGYVFLRLRFLQGTDFLLIHVPLCTLSGINSVRD